jgi:short subunit dehydrogenase-like uncharacterized protein
MTFSVFFRFVVDRTLFLINKTKKSKTASTSIPSGVLTPAVAFGATDMIQRLDASGVKFEVVSVKDL